MNHAVRVTRLGGPEVLEWGEVPTPEPGPGEVLIRHSAIGLNFIDVYFRTGLYPGPEVPFVPGIEAAGVVEAVGPDVQGLEVGTRVAYASRPLGAYSRLRTLAADRVVPLPDSIGDEAAAALMLKGMTAEFLLRRAARVERGDWVLVHAAAGGVGSLLCQWARHLGARVIGTVGSPEKARRAEASGCEFPVLYREEDVALRARELTGGSGVRVVYDSVGRDTFEASLDALAPRGMLVSFGQSSGTPPPFELTELARRGSLSVTRPSLVNYTATREDLVESSRELFRVVAAGALEVHIGQRFALADAARAHVALESRLTQGATILVP